MGNNCCSKKPKVKSNKLNKFQNTNKHNIESQINIKNFSNLKIVEKNSINNSKNNKNNYKEEFYQDITPTKLLIKNKNNLINEETKTTTPIKNQLGGSTNFLENSLNSYLCVVKQKSQNIENNYEEISSKLNNYSRNEFIKGKLIGTGRFGSVFSGLSANTGEIIAIKNLDQNLIKFCMEKLEKCYQKLKTLNHLNLINCLNVATSEIKSEFSIFYEFCNGSSIKILLEKYGEFDEKLIKKYVREILIGLKYLHDNKIIHKNLKSSNVLVDGNGTIRISDYLIEDVLMDVGENFIQNLKNQNEIPFWISPDIILNQNLDNFAQFDFWSLGCLIIEMATRKSPWHHYSINSSEEFINFIQNTNLIPTFPKKLSNSCCNFLNVLFNRKDIIPIEDLIDHEFFTKETEECSLRESQQKNNENLNTPNNSNKNSPLKYNIVNILNNENRDTFSVTMTMNNTSQYQSVFNRNLLSVLQDQSVNNFPINKKILITENILEEMDPENEKSPNVKRGEEEKKYFDFKNDFINKYNSNNDYNDESSQNSYNYVHEANKYITRQSNIVNTDSYHPFRCNIDDKYDKYNNLDFEEILNFNKEKISDIKNVNTEINYENNFNLGSIKIEENNFNNLPELFNNNFNLKSSHKSFINESPVEKLSLMQTVTQFKRKQNTFDMEYRIKNSKESEDLN